MQKATKPPSHNFFGPHPPKTAVATSSITKTILQKHLPLILAIGWTLTILYLSASSTVKPPPQFSDLLQADKLAHLVAYGIHCGLLLWAFEREKWPLWWALVASISWGILMEWMQYAFFPGRYFEGYDIVANCIGCFLAFGVYKLIHS